MKRKNLEFRRRRSASNFRRQAIAAGRRLRKATDGIHRAAVQRTAGLARLQMTRARSP